MIGTKICKPFFQLFLSIKVKSMSPEDCVIEIHLFNSLKSLNEEEVVQPALDKLKTELSQYGVDDISVYDA